MEAGFEPTYKGLKPRSGGRNERPESRFEPTYKGLKQISAGRHGCALVGFEPTYKGLKPHVLQAALYLPPTLGGPVQTFERAAF